MKVNLPRRDAIRDEFGSRGSWNGHPPFAQRPEPPRIGVDADHVMVPFGQARTRDETYVAQTDYGYTHFSIPPYAEASVLRLTATTPTSPRNERRSDVGPIPGPMTAPRRLTESTSPRVTLS